MRCVWILIIILLQKPLPGLDVAFHLTSSWVSWNEIRIAALHKLANWLHWTRQERQQCFWTVIIFSSSRQRCCIQDQRAVTMETATNSQRCVWVFQAFMCELSVHVQLSLSPSVCPLQLPGYVLPVSCLNLSFYLLLMPMLVWSVHPTNPTDIYGTFFRSLLVWNHYRSSNSSPEALSPWRRKTIKQWTSAAVLLCSSFHTGTDSQSGVHSEMVFLQMRICILVFWLVWFLPLEQWCNSVENLEGPLLQKYSFILWLSLVIISIYCLSCLSHTFTSVWNGKCL